MQQTPSTRKRITAGVIMTVGREMLMGISIPFSLLILRKGPARALHSACRCSGDENDIITTTLGAENRRTKSLMENADEMKIKSFTLLNGYL